MGGGNVPKGRQSSGVRLRAHTRGVLETNRTVGPGGSQHWNVAEAVEPYPGSLRSIARGVLSLLSAELLQGRKRRQPIDYQLCHHSKDACAGTDMAAAPIDLRQDTCLTAGDPGENGY